MKPKDIAIVAVCGVVFIGAIYFAYTMLFPSGGSTPAKTASSSTTTKTTITGNIDTDTLSKLKSYKDYGGSSLDNIGRVNPFGPLN